MHQQIPWWFLNTVFVVPWFLLWRRFAKQIQQRKYAKSAVKGLGNIILGQACPYTGDSEIKFFHSLANPRNSITALPSKPVVQLLPPLCVQQRTSSHWPGRGAIYNKSVQTEQLWRRERDEWSLGCGPWMDVEVLSLAPWPSWSPQTDSWRLETDLV